MLGAFTQQNNLARVTSFIVLSMAIFACELRVDRRMIFGQGDQKSAEAQDTEVEPPQNVPPVTTVEEPTDPIEEEQTEPFDATYFQAFDPNWVPKSFSDTDGQKWKQRVVPTATNDFAFLEDAHDFLSQRIALIRGAQRSVRLQTFIYKADEAGFLFLDELRAAVDRGVKVSVIVDPIMLYELKARQIVGQLVRAGVEVRGYEFAYRDYMRGINRPAPALDAFFNNANMRYHEKAFVVDAELPDRATAIIGGTNIANEYFIKSEIDGVTRWMDRDAIVRGSLAVDVGRKFDENFQEITTIYHRDFIEELGAIDQFIRVGELLHGLFVKVKRPDRGPVLEENRQAIENRRDLEWNPSLARFIQSRPRHQEDLIFPFYLQMIHDAKEEILICNSYMIPSEELIDALLLAMRRGVNIKILTNHLLVTDIPQQNLVARARYKYLLAANLDDDIKGTISIHEWAGDPVLSNGWGLNHSKYAVFDGAAMITGSYNLDPRSRILNSESILAYIAPEMGESYRQVFLSGIEAQYSQEITLEQALEFASPDGLSERFKLALSELLARFL